MIEKMLVISTCHVPDRLGLQKPQPDDLNISTFRCETHGFGWIVFLGDIEDFPEYTDLDPGDRWLEPIIRLAVEHGATVINFDCDANKEDSLPAYDW